MKRTSLVAAAATLVFAQSVFAQDKPPEPVAPTAPTAPAAKHVNKITDAAKAAFEKMDKIRNNPVAKGLKEASGTIESAMGPMTTAMKFTFKAPADIHVEADPNMQGPMAMGMRQMARGAESTLRTSFGVFDEGEFDADMIQKDGKDLLLLVSFKGDVEEGRAEYTLDGNGLIATGAMTSKDVGRDGQAREVKSDIVFTWAKSGDLWRIEKFEITSTGGRGGRGGRGGAGGGGAGAMGGGKMTITLTYSEAGDFAIATSWKTGMGDFSTEARITELTVNGKKVEIKTPDAAPPTKKAAKMGDDEDGDDDEDGEGHEKHGKK